MVPYRAIATAIRLAPIIDQVSSLIPTLRGRPKPFLSEWIQLVLTCFRDGKNRGTVASLTLGGYDKLRFVPHDHKFALDPVTRLPTVRLRGITAHVDSIEHAPTKNWTSTSHPLVTMDDSIIAIIDSSTPYLWLPTPVCERFAAALNLTWREDLGVYVFANGAQYTHYQNDESLKFTFTLSSYQNADDFGQPLSTPGVVNITLPSAAFAQLLRYPFRNVIKWGDSSIPYFPLKRSTKEVNNEQYIIGRVFMQEAYLITSYDRSSFSLHQALFPQNASSNYSLEAIPRPPDSPYPPYRNEPTSPSLKGGLNTAQKAGIALGILITLGLLSLFLYFRHQHKRPSKENKDTAGAESERTEVPAALQEEVPTSPVKRMFTKIVSKKRSRKTVTAGSDGSSGQPVEVGADAQHQVYEMPVPPEPVELDSNDVGDDITELGLDTTQGLSQYEITRRKLERQMRGPVPAYTPPENGMAINIQEKSAQDISPIPHYRPADEPSPASSPTYANSSTLPYSLPSPLTPHGEWTSRMTDLPSPMTIAPPTRFPGPSSEQEAGISLSPGPSPVTPRSVHFPPSMAPTPITCSGSNPAPTTPTSGTMPRLGPPVQRTPIDPSRVVCLGPLPENIQLQLPQQPVPRLRIPQSPLADLSSPGVGPSQSLGHYRSDTQGSTDTLGSNYTMEEAERLKELERQHGLIMARSSQVQEQGENSSRQRETGEQKTSEGQIEHRSASSDTRESRSPNSEERIETGFEIIHVPQMAEKRYSFEVGDDS